MNFLRLIRSQDSARAFANGVQRWLVLACVSVGLGGGRVEAAPAPAAATPNIQFNALLPRQRTEIHRKTDEAFWGRHPELNRAKLKADSDPKLIQEYMALRGEITTATLQTSGRDNSRRGQDAAGARHVSELDATGGRPGVSNGRGIPEGSAVGGLGAGRSSSPAGSGAGSSSTGLVTHEELAARGRSMASEMNGLASEYENATPARQRQILARFQQLYGEAIQLRDQSLALSQSQAASAGPEAPPTLPGSAATGAPLAGTVTANGKLIPATSLALSPEKYLASLAAERENKARARAEQERIYLEDAKVQGTYRGEGVSDLNKAAARAGLDVFNGVGRVGVAAFAPEWVYQGYEGLNAGAESVNAAKGLKLWDTAKNARSSATAFKDAGDAVREGIPSEPSELTRFDKFGRAMNAVDLGVNAADFVKARRESKTFEQAKEGVDIVGNVVSLADVKSTAGVARRILSGTKGALAVGEGVHNINQTVDDKFAFEDAADLRIQQAEGQARTAAERARLNQQLARFLLDLEARSHNETQLVVPPSQNQNQEHFKTN